MNKKLSHQWPMNWHNNGLVIWLHQNGGQMIGFEEVLLIFMSIT